MRDVADIALVRLWDIARPVAIELMGHAKREHTDYKSNTY